MKDEELFNNINSPNYIICKLHGFNNLSLTKNSKHEVNDNIIKSIFIDDNLENMVVEFQNDIRYSEHKQEIENYLYHLCFNLIIKTEVDYETPYYNIRVICENNKNITINEKLGIRDSLDIHHSSSSESIYNKIIDEPTNITKHYMKYERIFKTLHNPNIIVQFMSLYEFLMELLKDDDGNIKQKNVINYLTINKDKYEFLYFKETRKRVREPFDEDCFTYIRNEIGHCEETNDLQLYRNLGNNITKQTIKNLIKVINDVIIEEDE